MTPIQTKIQNAYAESDYTLAELGRVLDIPPTSLHHLLFKWKGENIFKLFEWYLSVHPNSTPDWKKKLLCGEIDVLVDKPTKAGAEAIKKYIESL